LNAYTELALLNDLEKMTNAYAQNAIATNPRR